MKQHAYYVISDIHLERKNEYKKSFLLNSINLVIQDNNQQNIQTVIVFSGDVDNGLQGYEWLKKIKCPIVYVAGNHEFWNNDYYETIISLKEKAPENISFLHNDFVEIGQYLFLGGTMWTDVGKTLNDDLKYVSNGVMNDNYNITAKKWYNPENIEKLKKIIPKHTYDNIEKCGWNILIEQEENEKTTQFFKDFTVIRSQMLKLQEEYKSSEASINGKYPRISKEQYDAIHKLIDMKSFTYKQWLVICKQFNLLGYEAVDSSMITLVSSDQEEIFKKLSHMDFSKELIVVSHHLPFLEERLVGYYSHIENSQKLINEKANNSIYTIRNGLGDYPYHNYFYRISKGEFSRDDSIVQAIHYSNNGAVNLPQNLYNQVKAWCHGHDHTLNYQDLVKGVNIVTNPLSYSMEVFKFSDTGISLSDNYKQYHNINTKEEELSEVKKLQKRVLKPIDIIKHKKTKEMVKLWVFHLMDKEKIANLLESFTQNNKKYFTYLAKNPEFSVGQFNEKQYQKIQEFTFANYYYFNELNKELDLLDLAYAARYDENFSFMAKTNKHYKKEITNYFYGESSDNIVVENFTKAKIQYYGYELLTSQIFKNIYYLNKGVKRMKHILSVIENMNDITSVTQLYDISLPSLYPKEQTEDYLFDRELNIKKDKILSKYLTSDIKEIKENRYKDDHYF